MLKNSENNSDIETKASLDATDPINVLMYHSISHEPGPTSIPPDVFREQMATLRDCGYNSVKLSDLASWHSGETILPPRSCVITFDDGFADFADDAMPVLEANKLTATVFLPAAQMGSHENWDGPNGLSRRLMTWQQAAELANQGVEFGSHSMTHADLTTLGPEELHWELHQSRSEMEQHLQTTPVSFAPPYGRSSSSVRAAISKCYRISVGTRLQRASRQCDLFDVPRVEMHYFRNPDRWRAYLEGRGEWFFLARRVLRRIRAAVSNG